MANEQERISIFFDALQIANDAHLASNLMDALVGIALLRVHEGCYEPAFAFTLYALAHPACTQMTELTSFTNH